MGCGICKRTVGMILGSKPATRFLHGGMTYITCAKTQVFQASLRAQLRSRLHVVYAQTSPCYNTAFARLATVLHNRFYTERAEC